MTSPPMEFVVKVLTTVFYKSSVEAETLMLQVHKSNSAVVGIYSYDIAHSKVQKATRMARNERFPPPAHRPPRRKKNKKKETIWI